MTSLERILWLVEHDNYYKIHHDDVWVGAVNIQKLDDAGSYRLHIINILPQHQGKGIGQAAIRLAEGLFPDARNWRLETLEDMPGNRHVYEKAGYRFAGETEKINDKLTIVSYQK